MNESEIEGVDYAALAYAVCVSSPGEDSDIGPGCEWEGWIIEAAFRESDEKYWSSTGDKVLPADYSQRCPCCGGMLFRVSKKWLYADTEAGEKGKTRFGDE